MDSRENAVVIVISSPAERDAFLASQPGVALGHWHCETLWDTAAVELNSCTQYSSGTELSNSHMLSHSSLQSFFAANIIIKILQMNKLEMEELSNLTEVI